MIAMVCIFIWACQPIFGTYERWYYELGGNGTGVENNTGFSSYVNIENNNSTTIATTTIVSDQAYCQYTPFMLAFTMEVLYGVTIGLTILAFVLSIVWFFIVQLIKKT